MGKTITKSPTAKNSPLPKGAPLRIALFGTFDVDNYGDCLFPLIVKHGLEKRLGNIELYPFSPTGRMPRIANYSKVYAFNELGEIFREPPAAFIIGGGALLTTEHALSIYPQIRNVLYPYSLKCWLLPTMIANSWNCPTLLNAVGFGLFDEAFNDLAARYLSKVTLCLVRDPFTADRLSRLNVDSEIVPDSALLLPDLLTAPEWKSCYQQLARQFGIPGEFIVAQISLHLGAFIAQFSNAVADVAVRTGLPVVLVPICHHHSDIASLKIMQRILRRRHVETYFVDEVLTTLHTSSILAMSELYIGTSLHGALASIAFGKRAISFSSSKMTKQRGVLSMLGLENCHCWHTKDIPARAMQLIQQPENLYRDKAEVAAGRVNDYFDRMGNIIQSQRDSSIPREWKQKRSTGEVTCGEMGDFQRVKQLCIAKKQEVNRWKALLQYLVRKNYTTSQHYDHLLLWLRTHGILVKRATEKGKSPPY